MQGESNRDCKKAKALLSATVTNAVHVVVEQWKSYANIKPGGTIGLYITSKLDCVR